SPVSLKNQPKPESYQTPLEFENALQDFERNRRRYEWAKNQVLYEDKENHPFIHLMDGGLADNLGVRFISDSFRRGTIRELINNDAIKRLVIIIVNAGTEPPEDLDRRESPQRRTYFLSLPTSFSLERQQVDDLIAVGGELLEKSPEFRGFMQSLKP